MAQTRLEILVGAKDQATGILRKIGGVLGDIGKAAAGLLVADVIANAARTVVSFGKDAIAAGSDLQETYTKVGVIFGNVSDDIDAFAKNASADFGQTRQQAMDAASTFGIFGKAAGLTEKDLSGFSLELTGLASDLASFYNTSVDDAIISLGAALRGESEPIRRYGVLLDDATLRAKALELGIVSTTKNALTPQQRVLAAHAVIMEQTKDAQGDFARTSDGLANSQRILRAEFENLKTNIGSALLPAMTELTKTAAAMFTNPEFKSGVESLITTLGNLALWFVQHLPAAIQFLSDVYHNVLLPAITAVSEYFTTNVLPVLQEVWAWLQTNLPVALETLSEFWTDTLLPAVEDARAFLDEELSPALSDVWVWLQDNLPRALDTLAQFWKDVLLPAVAQVYENFQTDVLPTLRDLWSILEQVLPPALALLGGFFTNVLLPAVSTVWSFFVGSVLPILQELDRWLRSMLTAALQALADYFTNVLLPNATIVYNFFRDHILPVLEDVWAFLTESLIPIFSELSDLFQNVVGKAVETLAIIWRDNLLPALTDVWNWINEKLSPIFKTISDFIRDVLAPAVDDFAAGPLASLRDGIAGLVSPLTDVLAFLGDLNNSIANLDVGKLLSAAGLKVGSAQTSSKNSTQTNSTGGFGSTTPPRSASPSSRNWAGRAFGGNVLSGLSYLVGEMGPELFVPFTSGRVVPNHDLRQMANSNTYILHHYNTYQEPTSVIADFRLLEVLHG